MLQLRRRYRKIYEDYKPGLVFWKVVLIVRKFTFALIVVLLDNNVEARTCRPYVCVR
jgi:hypothetical protein